MRTLLLLVKSGLVMWTDCVEVKSFVRYAMGLCKPSSVYVMNGSEEELSELIQKLIYNGTLKPLKKYNNKCFSTRSDPRDVVFDESQIFTSTPDPTDALTAARCGTKNIFGNWLPPKDMENLVKEKFTDCMQGREMLIVPFAMAPLNSPFSQVGVQLTDSAYAALNLSIMTRVGNAPMLKLNKEQNFIRALHSVGQETETVEKVPHWPCDPANAFIGIKPLNKEVISYGSGYGWNSNLAKKWFGLRIASFIGLKEDWLAEHMAIFSLKPHQRSTKIYMCAALPTSAGKTALASMSPSTGSSKVEIVGDDIAWLKFNSVTKKLHALNPEVGVFGLTAGASCDTIPNVVAALDRKTFFINTATTSDGDVYWEGINPSRSSVNESRITVTDWRGQLWEHGSSDPAAEPNSRYTVPLSNFPSLDVNWRDPEGVPVSAIILGTRRSCGVPLVYESFSWDHGVFIGATLRTETEDETDQKEMKLMNDPFARRLFLGCNFSEYIEQWLSIKDHFTGNEKPPKIFHVNWFRRGQNGDYLWPGFGENIRILEWIAKRLESNGYEDCEFTPIGYVPKLDAIDLSGLCPQPDMRELLTVTTDFLEEELCEVKRFFHEQLSDKLPLGLHNQFEEFKISVEEWNERK